MVRDRSSFLFKDALRTPLSLSLSVEEPVQSFLRVVTALIKCHLLCSYSGLSPPSHPT